MARQVLVTGFGPFGDVEDNPSAVLAANSGAPHVVLPVVYEAVDRWLATVDPASFDALLCLGVAVGSQEMRMETIAHNRVGPYPDVENARRPKRIEPRAPYRLKSPFWHDLGLPDLKAAHPELKVSRNAGTYLCNYLLYRATRAFPTKPVGFLHVCEFTVLAQEVQTSTVQRVVTLVGR